MKKILNGIPVDMTEAEVAEMAETQKDIERHLMEKNPIDERLDQQQEQIDALLEGRTS